jgi:hypothetical protein
MGALRILADIAVTAAAAGQPIPLQRLVVQNGFLLQPHVCHHTLAPLFSSLHQLQHLHLYMWCEDDGWEDDTGYRAAVAALAPLRHLTSLTSLYLHGPSDMMGGPYCDAELLSCFPSSLARLEWDEPHSGLIDSLECDRGDGVDRAPPVDHL